MIVCSPPPAKPPTMSAVQLSPPADAAEKHAYLDKNNVVGNPDERRRAALAEIDDAKFSWFHAKACIVAGESIFAVSCGSATFLHPASPPHHPSTFLVLYIHRF